MKAAELIHNEPFADLLVSTLSSFLTLHFGGDWRISWIDSTWDRTEQSWLVNLNINAIFRGGVSPQALENIKREFSTSVVRWKRPFQRLYFWLATSAAARLTAHAVLRVEPSIPGASQCLIIPGTHKIRFVDAAEGIVYCHLKSGSSSAHFHSEIRAREFAASKGLPVPRIVHSLSENCIAEEVVVGTPLNRLTSSEEQAIGVQRALDAMQLLYRPTSRQTSIAEYEASIMAQVAAMSASREGVSPTGMSALAQRLCGHGDGAGEEIEIVRSHGDFQPGNILYNNGEIWLIDWEYSQDRQRQYDLLTYRLGTRFAKGMGKRIAAYADSIADSSQLRLLRLFLLETIMFELEALMVSTSHNVPKSLIAKMLEIEKALPSTLRNRRA